MNKTPCHVASHPSCYFLALRKVPCDDTSTELHIAVDVVVFPTGGNKVWETPIMHWEFRIQNAKLAGKSCSIEY